jgi:hypothetical protein
LFAHHFVKGGVELARLEGFTGLDGFATVPPVSVQMGEDFLL